MQNSIKYYTMLLELIDLITKSSGSDRQYKTKGIPLATNPYDILNYILTNHYVFYAKYKLYCEFKVAQEQEMEKLYGKDTLLSLQKTIEYNELCDVFYENRDNGKNYDDMQLIDLALVHTIHFKAVIDEINFMQKTLDNIETVFYFCDFLDSHFAKK